MSEPSAAAGPTEPLLTAAMIVRNEAHHLPACLESIRDVVDEIVIVDTGSTDDTVAIARSFGARLEHHPWQEDFATPRNLGLDLARGRWILYIDADERVRPLDVEAFRQQLNAAEEIALRVRLKLFGGATPAWEYRLWRSDPRIRFVGVMHEKVTPAIAAVAEADRRPIGESPLLLDHVGYDGDQTHKHRRNLPLLRAALASEPDNPYNLHHLAHVLRALGDEDGADAALDHALEVVRERPSDVGALVFFAAILRSLERGDDASALLGEALDAHPEHLGFAWCKMVFEVEAGRHDEALRLLERFDVDPEVPVDDTFSYAAELFGARAAEARALCLFRLERYADAAVWYAEAERLEPEQPAHRLKRVIAEHRARTRPRPAPVSSPDPWQWRAREVVRGLVVDVGGIPVGLSASDARRAEAIRTLLGRLPATGAAPRVMLTFTAHPLPVPGDPPEGEFGGLRVWYRPALTLALEGVRLSGRVEAGTGRLGGSARNLGAVFRLAGSFMLGRLLAPLGVYVLHAAAIERDGTACLILGGSGSGKSTTAFAAQRAGWRVVADDVVLLRMGGGGAEVHGLPKRLAVPQELTDGEPGARPIAGDIRGRVELPFTGWMNGWHPIGNVVLSAHGDGAASSAEPLDGPDLLSLLIGSGFSRHPDDLRGLLGVGIHLCRLPAHRLRHAATADRRTASSAALLGELAAKRLSRA